MTDREIFKAELDRLKEETSIGLSEWENGVEHGRMEIINALYKTLDSMQEEPTIPDIVDEHYREMLGEELVSEDLDSFAIKYAQDKPYPVTVCQAVKVGANWQAEQDKQWLAENHKNIFAKGRDSMKQRMMKNAITAECFGAQSGDALFSIRLPAKGYLVGSEIKVIIIKEE